MRTHLLYFISFAAIISTVYLSAQFTEKRNKRVPSMSTLQESCCTALADVLHASSDLLCSIGSVQKRALAAIEAYAHADKQGWCATASRQTLTTCQAQFEKLHAHIEELTQECTRLEQSMNAA